MTKFKIGDRVARATSIAYDDNDTSRVVPLRYDIDNGLLVGSITDIAANKITVQWDNSWSHKSEVVSAKDLITEAEGLEKYSELEAEFLETQKELKVKVKEIAKGIHEANKIAKKTGHNLADMFDLVYSDLYPAMDAAGWRTSSFGC